MTLIERIDKHKVLYGYLAIAAYLLINNTINVSTVWMEHSRDGNPGIGLWEPITWEYSSAISSFVLLPLLFWMFQRFPLRFGAIKRQLMIHLAGTLVFSIAHVTIMVSLRELVYWLMGGNYDFGNWSREFFYEYQKDAWGYVFWLFIYQMVQFIYSRLKGEASPIAESEEQATTQFEQQTPQHFLLKKLDQEFLVKVSEIEWIESAGNYVNLHSKGRIYPLRATLSNICDRLQQTGFSRIHRSHAVNHTAIEHISYQPSGDGEVQLKSGLKLNLSRRYKDNFKQALT